MSSLPVGFRVVAILIMIGSAFFLLGTAGVLLVLAFHMGDEAWTWASWLITLPMMAIMSIPALIGMAAGFWLLQKSQPAWKRARVALYVSALLLLAFPICGVPMIIVGNTLAPPPNPMDAEQMISGFAPAGVWGIFLLITGIMLHRHLRRWDSEQHEAVGRTVLCP